MSQGSADAQKTPSSFQNDQLQTGNSNPPHIATQQEHNAQLKAEKILLEEFRNASSSTTQAQQDRSSLFNLYLLIAGIILTGLGVVLQSLQASGAEWVKTLRQPLEVVLLLLVVVVLALAALLSFAFFRRLLGLLQEQYEATIGMEVIKKFYIEQLKNQIPLEQVLLWKPPSFSSLYAPGSPTFLMGFIMAIIGSLYISAAISLLISILFPATGPSIYSNTYGYIVSIPLFIGVLILHFLYFKAIQKKIYEKTNQLLSESAFTKAVNESA